LNAIDWYKKTFTGQNYIQSEFKKKFVIGELNEYEREAVR
jgi:hypothetical protein